MTNAGKRGKKVQELTLVPNTHDDALSEKIIKHAVSIIIPLSYDSAKSYLQGVQSSEKTSNLFGLSERLLRGVDVEPMGTKIELEKKFPDGTIVSVTASHHEFHVKHSQLISGKDFASFRQDTLYWSVGKLDGAIFYAWLKDNLSKAANMTMAELERVWQTLGVSYDSH
jgi:hypothetical protein